MLMLKVFVSTFGFLFVIRILRLWKQKSFLSENIMTKIGTLLFLVLLLLFQILSSPLLHLLSVFALVVLLFLSEKWVLSLCERRLRDQFLPLVQQILLFMKTGDGFRSAFRRAIEDSDDGYFKSKVGQLYQAVVFSQHHSVPLSQGLSHPFFKRWSDYFVQVDQQSHLAIQRLNQLALNLKIESDFRQRSGQVLSQVHLQCLVLSGLYFAVLIFVVWQFGFLESWRLIVASLLLFLVGLILTYSLGKNIKWKL